MRDLEVSRLANDKTQAAVKAYPGRFIGGAHVNPLHGADALREFNRCKAEFGFPGVVITSEIDGVFIDDPALEPFWNEATQARHVRVHPPVLEAQLLAAAQRL